jgi:hypothetical protein
MEGDGIMILPVVPDSPITDFTHLTFDGAIAEWVKQYSGHKPSRMTIFRGLEQRGLSTNK